jgi:hypothetical protein
MLGTWDRLVDHPYAVGFGTLLGSVRDQDIISWTSDVDVIVPDHAALLGDEVLREKLLGAGMMLFEDVPVLSRICLTADFPGVGPWVLPQHAGWRFTDDQPYMDVYHMSGNTVGPCTFPDDMVRPINATGGTIHGKTYPTPSDPERFLTYVYGKGWPVPDNKKQPHGDGLHRCGH